MKIAIFSDTHGYKTTIPAGIDVAVFAGDFSHSGGNPENLENFLKWFEELPCAHKIFIAGNHDRFLENNPALGEKIIKDYDVIYLQDSGVTINKINFWGSPVQPNFCNWAFNRKRGAEIKRHWDMIPNDTDVLITHGPPHRILDATWDGDRPGCRDLYEAVLKVQPDLHCFGHIHYSYGALKLVHDQGNYTYCVNGAIVGENYKPTNKPIVYDFASKAICIGPEPYIRPDQA